MPQPRSTTPTGRLLRGEPAAPAYRHAAGYDQFYPYDPSWNVHAMTVTGENERGDSQRRFQDLGNATDNPSLIQAYKELGERARTGPYPFTVNLTGTPEGPQQLIDTRDQRHENVHAIDALMGREKYVSSSRDNPSATRREALGPGNALAEKGRGGSVTELVAYGGTDNPETLDKVFGASRSAVPGTIAGFLHNADKNFADTQLMGHLKSQFSPSSRREIDQAGRHFTQVDQQFDDLEEARGEDSWERFRRGPKFMEREGSGRGQVETIK